MPAREGKWVDKPKAKQQQGTGQGYRYPQLPGNPSRLGGMPYRYARLVEATNPVPEHMFPGRDPRRAGKAHMREATRGELPCIQAYR